MSSLIKLPVALVQMIAAQNAHNAEDFSRVFAENAYVYDEGKDYHGRVAVKSWNEATNKKYQTMLEPLGLSQKGDEII